MRFKYIKVDETKYWKPEFVATWGEGGKIIVTYIYDSETHTHCCELTPSYEMRYAGFDLDLPNLSDEDREKIDEEVIGNMRYDSDHYRHCHRVSGKDCSIDFESIEEALEHFQGNPW